ncbi:response regulator [candidate division KSB1 bacterium]|nr:response regulator [candidate division KSB1 bacterium]
MSLSISKGEPKKHEILIVDDDPGHIQIIINYLEAADELYKIYQALEGQKALSIARVKKPDLIITDWDMPDLSGIELIRQLKDDPETQDILVIMATGVMTSSKNLQTALDAGAMDFIRKPIDKIELIARIKSMLVLSDSFKEIVALNKQLQTALQEVKQLSGMLPICANCKKIRSDKGYWTQIEDYIREHSEARFTHSICPECYAEYFPDDDVEFLE